VVLRILVDDHSTDQAVRLGLPAFSIFLKIQLATRSSAGPARNGGHSRNALFGAGPCPKMTLGNSVASRAS